jgi:DNA ligase-associated metallophosphoesterase
MSDTFSLTIAEESLILYPERAVFWARTATLLAADLHWGKDAAFRAGSIPVPGGSLIDDLMRLDAALARHPTQRLILLGDLLHARESLASEVIEAVALWRDTWADIEMILVRGNHDRHVRALPESWRMTEIRGELVEAPFVLRHTPTESDSGYVLAGHIHPAVELRGKGRQILRVPCFWFGAKTGLLPAFGTFTGLAVVHPKAEDTVIGVIENKLLTFKDLAK